jgi:hypothetical protein
MASRPVALHRAGIRIYLLLKGGDDTQQYGDYLSRFGAPLHVTTSPLIRFIRDARRADRGRRRARARGGRRPRPRAGRGTASAPDRSRYAPSRSRTREASAGARGPGARRSSHAGKLYIYRTSTPTVANHGAARRYLSSTATGSPLRHWSSFSRYAFLASISPSIRSSMSGPRWPPLRRGAGGVGGRGQWRADAPRQCRMHRPGVPRRSRHRAASACGFLPCHGGSPVRVPYRNRHGADRSALGFRR